MPESEVQRVARLTAAREAKKSAQATQNADATRRNAKIDAGLRAMRERGK